MYIKILATLLYLNNSFALISPGELAMIQTATNTLNSMRELNDILTESRQFSENFERVYSKVDQGIWKADRTVTWLEDIKALEEVDIENVDDFNYVLRGLKNQSRDLRLKLLKYHNENKANQLKDQNFKKDKKRIQRQIVKYRSESKSSMSPNAAQVETAKNTKDLLIENAKLNASIKDLNSQMATLIKYRQEKEKENIARSLKDKEKMRLRDKGILSKRDVKK